MRDKTNIRMVPETQRFVHGFTLILFSINNNAVIPENVVSHMLLCFKACDIITLLYNVNLMVTSISWWLDKDFYRSPGVIIHSCVI